MNKIFASALAATFLVASPVALTGCQTETQREVESDGDVDYDTEIGVDESAVDEFQNDAETFGNEVEEGAREVGADIERGARDAEDAIDENIDLGDNAGTPEVDDNN